MVASNPATMLQKITLLRGWRAFCTTATSCFDARSRILMLNAIGMNRTFASGSPVSTPVSAYRLMMFGRSGFGSNPLRRSAFQFASSSGEGGGVGDSGGGVGGSGPGGGDFGGGGSGGHNGSNWSLLSWYLSLLAKHPVLTKAISAGILNLVGDLICQLLVDRVQNIDVKRSFIFTLLGAILVGPTLHYWYLFLSKLVTTPGNTGAILRLILDQFFFSPIFIGFFLASLMTLDGKPSHIIPKLQQDWFSAVVANWQLWIPFQFFNFRYVPQQFQVLASNFFALIWNVVLSYKAHKDVLVK